MNRYIAVSFMACGLSTMSMTAGWERPMAVADQGTPVVVNCSGQPEVKPQHIMFFCADNTWNIDNLAWTSWSADGAKGTGIEFRDNCVPNCAQGSAIYSPVTVTLTGASPPDFHYTSAVITNQNTGTSETFKWR